MKVIRGLTHCDDIGDIFKNPYVFRFIAQWHEVKKGEKLKMRIKEKEGISFSPEYYEFIREVFEERTHMESFLQFVREMLIEAPTLYEKIQNEHTTHDIIKALLSFDELQDQLSAVDNLTVSGVFNTKIVDIIRGAYTRQIITPEEDDYDEDENNYPTMFYAVKAAIENGVLPIDEEGKIIARLGEGNAGHMVTDVGGDETPYEIDALGKIISQPTSGISIKGEQLLDTRVKIISHIRLLERIISHHFSDISDIFELSEAEEQIYIDKQIAFDAQKSGTPGNIIDIHFGLSLIEEKNECERKLIQLQIEDRSQLEEWESVGIQPGIQRDLPQDRKFKEQIVGKKGFKLKVIS